MHAQTITMLPAEPVLAQLAELSQKLDRALAAAESGELGRPEYLPMAQLARHFGLNRSTMRKYAAAARAEGALRILSPYVHGINGNPLFHVSDMTAYLDGREKSTRDKVQSKINR